MLPHYFLWPSSLVQSRQLVYAVRLDERVHRAHASEVTAMLEVLRKQLPPGEAATSSFFSRARWRALAARNSRSRSAVLSVLTMSLL